LSSGKTHARTSLVLAAPVGVAVAVWTRDPAAGVCAALGCASGVVLSPDLDVDHKTESEEQVSRWGPLFGIVFMTWWLPYALVMRHRSFWSHFPGISTTIRVLYAFWWLAPLSFAIRQTPGVLFWWFSLWYVVGLTISDTAHWVQDGMPVKVNKK